MKKIQQIVGEKLTREVSQLIGSPSGKQPEAADELTMEQLVNEAANESLRLCFADVREHLKQDGKTFSSWKELYADMIEGWMDHCQRTALSSSSAKLDSQYVASRVIAASLLLQIGKEDTSYAQLCDAWAHRSKSPPPGRKQFRAAMTLWINAHADEVMTEIRRLQEQFVAK